MDKENIMDLPIIDMAATGAHLNTLFTTHGFSVIAIKNYLGLNTTNAIYKWLHGKSIPSIDNLLALSILFNTNINELLVYRN